MLSSNSRRLGRIPEEKRGPVARVRAIFALYLEYQALLPVVRELDRRGWRTKRWRTRKGHTRGGRASSRNTLRQLLRNVTYLGHIRYKHEVHPGEQGAIVDAHTWQQVQTLLQARCHQPKARLPASALLQKLLPAGAPAARSGLSVRAMHARDEPGGR
jgi:site-specific DNA recombinase